MAKLNGCEVRISLLVVFQDSSSPVSWVCICSHAQQVKHLCSAHLCSCSHCHSSLRLSVLESTAARHDSISTAVSGSLFGFSVIDPSVSETNTV